MNGINGIFIKNSAFVGERPGWRSTDRIIHDFSARIAYRNTEIYIDCYIYVPMALQSN